MRWGIVFGGLLVLASTQIGCGSSSAVDQKAVEGDWNLVSVKGSPHVSGHLHLKSDLTFDGDKADQVPKGKPDEVKESKYSGTYSLSREESGGRTVLFVDFKVTSEDGREFRLGYDETRKVLQDLTTLTYCRPGDEAKTLQVLEHLKSSKH